MAYSRCNEERIKDDSTSQSYECSYESLQKCHLRGSVLNSRHSVERECVWLLALYCCDPSEAMDMSDVRHRVSVGLPCLRSMKAGVDIISGGVARERPVKETAMIRGHFLEISKKDRERRK